MNNVYIFLAIAVTGAVVMQLGIYYGKFLERRARIVAQRIKYKGYYILIFFEKKPFDVCYFIIRNAVGKFEMRSEVFGQYKGEANAADCIKEAKKWIDLFVMDDKPFIG